MPTKKKRINIIPDNLEPVLSKQEVVPSVYTGQKLADNDPVKYGKIVQELGNGAGLIKIARKYKCSPETIMAISKREKGTIDAVQSLTQGLTTYATQACLMKIIEKLEDDEIPAGVLPVAFGILRDKEKSDLGQATTITETRNKITINDVKAELEAMKANAIDITHS